MSTLGSIKRIINSQLGRFGLVVARDVAVPSFDRFVGAVRNVGLTPRTIMDIGVAYGTPWLYAPFSSTKFHLIDPTRESLPYMQEIAKTLETEIHNFGLGDRETEMTIAVRPEIDGSSLFEEVGECEISSTYEVPIKRFDHAFGDLERPLLCKIDVQGAELMVLKGMGDRLHDVDLFIIETSLIATLKGNAPEFAEVVKFLKDRGFVLYDIIGTIRRPLDKDLAQIDGVFVPQSSPLRTDRRWKSETRRP